MYALCSTTTDLISSRPEPVINHLSHGPQETHHHCMKSSRAYDQLKLCCTGNVTSLDVQWVNTITNIHLVTSHTHKSIIKGDKSQAQYELIQCDT